LNFLRGKNSDLMYDITPMQTNYFKNSDLLYKITPVQSIGSTQTSGKGTGSSSITGMSERLAKRSSKGTGWPGTV
jgi:hypothetical protein